VSARHSSPCSCEVLRLPALSARVPSDQGIRREKIRDALEKAAIGLAINPELAD